MDLEKQFEKLKQEVNEDGLAKVVAKLSPLFGLDYDKVIVDSNSHEEVISTIFIDGEYIQDGALSNYVIGKNTGIYLHRKAKPDFYRARDILLKTFIVTGRNFPSVDNTIRYYSFVLAPYNRFMEFVGHYCGLFNEGGDASLKQQSVRYRWITQYNPTNKHPEDLLAAVVCASVQMKEVIPPKVAAEYFLRELNPSDFTKVINLQLTSAYDYIFETAGVDLKKFSL